MIAELLLYMAEKRKKAKGSRVVAHVPRPDGWNPEMIPPYASPRPQAPRNNPEPTYLNKVVETIPAGERREVFALTGPGTFQIFSNFTNISVEVSEIFIFGIVAGSIQILQDEQAQTSVIPMAVNQTYIDTGFRLAINGTVSLLLSGATQVSGFLKWRYT
jgi:hypothetical protein